MADGGLGRLAGIGDLRVNGRLDYESEQVAIILRGMGWGHMQGFLVERELRSGRLISIKGRHFPGGKTEIVAARLRNKPHGPIANRLWQHVEKQAPAMRAIKALAGPASD